MKFGHFQDDFEVSIRIGASYLSKLPLVGLLSFLIDTDAMRLEVVTCSHRSFHWTGVSFPEEVMRSRVGGSLHVLTVLLHCSVPWRLEYYWTYDR